MSHSDSDYNSDFNRLHRLKTIHTDFRIVLNLIRTGYKFDDEEAPLVIQQLEKGLDILNSEIALLENGGKKKTRK